MSQVTGTALPSAAAIALTVSAAPAGLMSNTPTVTPSLARRSAMARPMPLPAPVTMAVLPLSPRMGWSPVNGMDEGSGSGAVAPEDGYGADVLVRVAAQVLRQAAVDLFQLALSGAAMKLLVDLVDHAQARGTDRVAEALEPAVGLDRQLAVAVEHAVEHVVDHAAGLAEAEVFHQHRLGDREAVVDLGHVDLGARVRDAGRRIGARTRDTGGRDVRTVPGLEAGFLAVADRDLERLDGDDLGVGLQRARD